MLIGWVIDMISNRDAFIAACTIACVDSLGIFVAAWVLVVRKVLDLGSGEVVFAEGFDPARMSVYASREAGPHDYINVPVFHAQV